MALVVAAILTLPGWTLAARALHEAEWGVARAAERAPAHRMPGRVIAVDVEHGVVIVETPEGTVALHGSPEQVDQVGVGDIIVLEFDERGDQPPAVAAQDEITA